MFSRIIVILGWIILAAPAPAQVVVFEENFDGPGAPAGWVLEEGWTLSTMTPSSGSGANSLQHKGNSATTATTPAINLSSASSASLMYLIRRTGSYASDNLVVKASADGGMTYPVTLLGVGSAVPATDSNWELISANIPNELLGSSEVVIRLEGQGLYTAGASSRIDDFTLTAVVPLEVTPQTLSFAVSVGESATESLTVTNRTSGTLTVGAPALTGIGFSIDPSGMVDIPPGGSHVYDLTFAAVAQGTVHGSVQLDYGSGTASVALSGTGSGGLLSFSAASSSTFEEEADVSVSLRLTFNAVTGLQGLQFRVTWTGEALTLADVERGPAIASTSEWSLSHESGPGYVDVVLLGDGGASLDGGIFEDVVSLHFDVGSVAATATANLSVESVIGALADPYGSDADLSPSGEEHVITIEPKTIFFSASTASVDLGEPQANESATATLTVSNPGGTADLVIEEIAVSHPLFSITPSTAQIAPNATVAFSITFRPTTTSFGRQDAEITFVHNGETKTDVISLTGKGRGGRGDADGDGIVDALDIVHAIDFVLNRLTPDAAQKTAADLFPFPEGDSDLDVRDLTVLAQAIVRGLWPDDIDLPVEESGPGTSEPGGIRLSVDPLMIEMAHDAPIRAFQIVLPSSEGAWVDLASSGIGTGTGQVQVDGGANSVGATVAFAVRATESSAEDRAGTGSGLTESAHELRVLVYRPDGGLIPPGAIHLATHGVIGRPRYVTVIGERRDRLRIDDSIWTSTESAPPSAVLPEAPYPNPFRAGGGVLRIPAGTGRHSAIVYDILGRVVKRWVGAGEILEWDGFDAAGRVVGSGLYLVRIESERDSRTHAIQVVR